MSTINEYLTGRASIHDAGQGHVEWTRAERDAYWESPRLVAALQAVTKVHEPMSVCTRFVPVCSECEEIGGGDVDYPCPTVRAIADALGVEP